MADLSGAKLNSGRRSRPQAQALAEHGDVKRLQKVNHSVWRTFQVQSGRATGALGPGPGTGRA